MFKIKQAQENLPYAPQMNICWLQNPRHGPSRWLLHFMHICNPTGKNVSLCRKLTAEFSKKLGWYNPMGLGTEHGAAPVQSAWILACYHLPATGNNSRTIPDLSFQGKAGLIFYPENHPGQWPMLRLSQSSQATACSRSCSITCQRLWALVSKQPFI